jgi:hypothetical protein
MKSVILKSQIFNTQKVLQNLKAQALDNDIINIYPLPYKNLEPIQRTKRAKYYYIEFKEKPNIIKLRDLLKRPVWNIPDYRAEFKRLRPKREAKKLLREQEKEKTKLDTDTGVYENYLEIIDSLYGKISHESLQAENGLKQEKEKVSLKNPDYLWLLPLYIVLSLAVIPSTLI